MRYEKCEKCFHFHPNAQECFKHNIPRHSTDRCSEYSKPKK